MYLSPYTHRSSLLAAFVLTVSTGAAMAAGHTQQNAGAQERYRQEIALCNSGQSHQDVKTCRLEARNALAEAKRGGLANTAPDQFSRNAVRRCAEFQGDERSACEMRVFNPSRVDGSVPGGGLVRESVIVVPAR